MNQPKILRIFLVRHGHYGGQPKPVELRSPAHNGNLTPLGMEQARRLGGRLVDQAFDCVYTTDTPRTRQTAAEVVRRNNHAPPLVAVKKLCEVQGDHVRPDPEPATTKRRQMLHDERQLVERFVRKLKKHRAGSNILVVGHGTLNCMLVHLLAERDPRQALPMGAANTGVTILEIVKGRRPPGHSPARLQLCNCTSHLAVDRNGRLSNSLQ